MTSITGKDNYLDEVPFYLLIVTKVPDFLLFPDSRKVKYCRAMKRREAWGTKQNTFSPELCRCIKAELLQKQDFMKLRLRSVRRISEEKGQNQPEREHSAQQGKLKQWKVPPTRCTVTASEMGHAAELFVAFCVQKCKKYN